jgi:hypothetical protein
MQPGKPARCRRSTAYKALFWIVVALVIRFALGFPLIAPWFY